MDGSLGQLLDQIIDPVFFLAVVFFQLFHLLFHALGMFLAVLVRLSQHGVKDFRTGLVRFSGSLIGLFEFES